ncbi:hypothetical protein RFI_26110 [Reticulomyxa filosa]|uniref:Uncharacterized protein n=1 Tax=Reticulomyxa filosa TaxID=46433 RepID=X6MB77_RETFI|nr:hypothetical protein RFI_26110 [Reticulomyxa filosa]|eukprot:ETO11268.1 hypothetical protein RFI_26110 [Reticulomyxa filosa]
MTTVQETENENEAKENNSTHNEKELKVLQHLYGDIMSEEELYKSLKIHGGDIKLVINSIVMKQLSKAEEMKSVQVDEMYLERIKQIDAITDRDTKSEKILWYACEYAEMKNEDLFVEILTKYAKDVIIDEEFEYRKMKVQTTQKKKKKKKKKKKF